MSECKKKRKRKGGVQDAREDTVQWAKRRTGERSTRRRVGEKTRWTTSLNKTGLF